MSLGLLVALEHLLSPLTSCNHSISRSKIFFFKFPENKELLSTHSSKVVDSEDFFPNSLPSVLLGRGRWEWADLQSQALAGSSEPHIHPQALWGEFSPDPVLGTGTCTGGLWDVIQDHP